MKVLIIDDSIVFHSYIKSLLEKNFSRLKLLFSKSGEEGLEYFHAQRPHLILLDLNMPGIHGLEVLKEIRREDEDVQIIIISRSDEEEILEEAFSLGANDYIVKGPRPREMVSRIKRALQTKEAIEREKRSYQKLVEEKRILEHVTFNANCGLLLLDRETEVLYANSIATQWFGDFQTLEGRPCHEILKTDARECTATKVLEEGQEVREEHHLKDGRILYIIASPVFHEEGEMEKITLVLVDITQRKKTEISLKNAVHHIRSVNETLLTFGPDHDANSESIVKAAARLTRADYVFYNEIHHGCLYIREAYNPPPNLQRRDDATGHICDYVVQKRDVEPVLLTDLMNSPFAKTDPAVKSLGLVSYLGCPVKVEGEVVGVLCALFTREVHPSESLLESMCTLARGLGVEVERKRTMESLRRFRSALDISADAIFLIDYQSMRFIDVNQEACESLGYSREELLSLGPHHIKPYYSKESLKNLFRDLIEAREKNGVIQTVHEHKDGSHFPVEVFLRYYKGERREYLIASVRDMTQHREMQERLKESEERYRLLVENQIDAVCLWEPDTTLLYVNDGYCKVFQREREELLGEKWISLIPEDRRESILAHSQDLVARPRTVRYSHPVVLADESISWFEWIDIPIKDEKDKVIKIQSVGRDITERIEAEREIKKRNEFEALITSLSTYFINLPVEKIDEGIVEGLRKISSFTSFDSAEIYLISEDEKSASISHQWPKEVREIDHEILMLEEDLPAITRDLKRLKTICISSVSQLREDMQLEKFFFQEEEVGALIIVPLSSGENLIGFLKFNLYSEERLWDKDTIPLFKITGAMFVNALERKRAEINLRDELEKARQLKDSLFPQILPSFKDIHVSGILKEASHVGGDYYNCYQVGDDLLFLMVDVTGHGLDAALITVFVSTFFRRELEKIETAPDPFELLSLLNNDFKQQGFPDDYFLEAFLGVLSLSTMEVHYAVAGAIRSLLFHPVDSIRELPFSKGSLIHNYITTPDFGGGRVRLRPGEALLIYTDGLDELLMTREYALGEGFMHERMKNLYGLLRPEDLLERAVDDVLLLLKRNQPPDDMSILGLFHQNQREEREYTCPRELGAVEDMIITIQATIDELQVDLDLVRMALHEALINGVLYSSGPREIKILVSRDLYRLTIIVDDGGSGFPWRERLNSREEFLAPREGGRGLELIEMATDSFAFNSRGNRVSLSWDLMDES